MNEVLSKTEFKSSELGLVNPSLEDGEEWVHEVVPLAEEAVKAEREGDDEEDDDDGKLEEGDEHVGEHDDVDAEEGELPDVDEEVEPGHDDAERADLWAKVGRI